MTHTTLTLTQQAAFARYADVPTNDLDADSNLSEDTATWLREVIDRLEDGGFSKLSGVPTQELPAILADVALVEESRPWDVPRLDGRRLRDAALDFAALAR